MLEDYLRSQGYSEQTIKSYSYALSLLLRFSSDPSILRNYVLSLPYSRGTKSLLLVVARRYFESLGPSIYSPLKLIPPIPYSPGKISIAEPVFEKYSLRDRLIISLLYDLLLFPREIIGLEVQDIEGSYLKVRSRILPLPPRTTSLIKAYLPERADPDSPYLFPSLKGGAIRRLPFSSMAIRRAGLKRRILDEEDTGIRSSHYLKRLKERLLSDLS